MDNASKIYKCQTNYTFNKVLFNKWVKLLILPTDDGAARSVKRGDEGEGGINFPVTFFFNI